MPIHYITPQLLSSYNGRVVAKEAIWLTKPHIFTEEVCQPLH